MQSELMPTTTNAQIIKAEIDLQITTAKSYPRDIKRSLQTAIETATLTPEIAKSCMYNLKRKSLNKATGKYEEKIIEGASVRLAEIIASSYGNLHAATRISENDGKSITAQAVAWDLEKNWKLTEEVKRRITDSSGKTYGDDMQTLTGNAARSIALRNAILKVVPRSITETVYEEAKRCVAGDISTLADRRKKAIEQFERIGVSSEKVLKYIKKKTIEEITTDDMPVLVGMFNAMKDNAFEPEEEKVKSKADELNSELETETNQ